MIWYYYTGMGGNPQCFYYKKNNKWWYQQFCNDISQIDADYAEITIAVLLKYPSLWNEKGNKAKIKDIIIRELC